VARIAAVGGVVLALVILAGLIGAEVGKSAVPSCRITGTAPFTAPDPRCTPGAFVRKTRADVCDGNTDRPNLPAAERRRLLANYGVPGWTGRDGEVDHLVPIALGGLTVRANLWVERGPIPNPKDRLEAVIYRRVCFGDPAPMRVRTAVRVFSADWRAAFTYYVLGRGPRP
jgi:hypothetical protein